MTFLKVPGRFSTSWNSESLRKLDPYTIMGTLPSRSTHGSTAVDLTTAVLNLATRVLNLVDLDGTKFSTFRKFGYTHGRVLNLAPVHLCRY